MWVLVQRFGMVLITALSMDQLLKVLSPRQIKADEVYSAGDVARMLRVDKEVVNVLIKRGDIKARSIDGEYKVLGQSIKDFLK